MKKGVSLMFFSLLGLLLLNAFGPSIGSAYARYRPNDNAVKPGRFIVEPATLICLGFEWYVEGDSNHNAKVTVKYRKVGDRHFKEAMPLLRVNREKITHSAYREDYYAPKLFAGSIMDLEPDTLYECLLKMYDPDGVHGRKWQRAFVRTRPEPMPYEGGQTYHVYPLGYNGYKEEPAFTGLMGAYFLAASGTDNSVVAPPRVEPGDTILVHAGTYKSNRFRYGDRTGVPFHGTYVLTKSGTPEKPIAIKAAGDGEVIFDGDGCYRLFDVMAADNLYFEGLTIRNTDIAFYAGLKDVAGSSGLTVKNCSFDNIGIGVLTEYSGSKNFYIADNTMLGRHDPDMLMGWTRGWSDYPGFPALANSYYGVKVYGQGHVVCHNYVAYFHDGICVCTHGVPDGYPDEIQDRKAVSIDFYNNDFFNISDNPIEVDGGSHNVRALRNRCFNSAHRALSAQTFYGGPAYFIRNIVYHAPDGGALKYYFEPAGIICLHNTLLAEVRISMASSPGPASNIHFRNNLILGQGVYDEIFLVDTFTNYSTSDYNGFRPNDDVEFPFAWNSPPFDVVADFDNPLIQRGFRNLTELAESTGQEQHGVIVDFDVFQDVAPPDPSDPTLLYYPENFNFQLQQGGVAIDAGCRLPNINDGYSGDAPDLGALEYGQPEPVYGPRP